MKGEPYRGSFLFPGPLPEVGNREGCTSKTWNDAIIVRIDSPNVFAQRKAGQGSSSNQQQIKPSRGASHLKENNVLE